MVALNYEIGYIENKNFIVIKKNRFIVKPRCMYINEDSIKFHNITQDYAINNGIDIDIIINNFKNDMKKVNIIISHNIDFHIKTILAEITRYNKLFDFNNYLIIDTISFYHNYGFIKLNELFDKLKIKKYENEEYNNLTIIKYVFFKLYSQFKKSIK
jgi:DNA polymerase III epsilon subunit-like protein